MKPIISIITIVYNNAIGIENTIRSVVNQTFDNYEYIVIDGGSSDGSLEIISTYLDKIDVFVSERDYGIFDALNKGVLNAKGKWVYFLNSGDYFTDFETLNRFYQKYLQYSAFEIVSGRVRIIDEKGKYLGYNHPNREVRIDDICKKNIIAHQATFVKKSVFNKIGMFGKYRIHMDYDFWIRAYKNNITFKLTNDIIANFTKNGVSSDRGNYLIALAEQYAILRKHKVINGGVVDKFRYYHQVFVFKFKNYLRLIVGSKLSNRIHIYKCRKS